MYQPKQELAEVKADRKLSGKEEEDEGKKEKKSKKREKKKHNSNSPMKEGSNDVNDGEKEETGAKINTHFYPKESKTNSKTQRPQWVKEYVVKK